MENKEYQKPTTTEIQTLIFDKGKFDISQAKSWAKEHDFHSGKMDETEDSIRLRQKDPEEFQEGSFRTIELKDGVKAVIGRPKSMENENSSHKKDEKSLQIAKEEININYAKEKEEEKREINFNALNGVEIFRVGTWNGDKYDISDLDAMVSSFSTLQKEIRPRLKLGHSDEQTLLKAEGLPAAGYIDRVYRINDKLFADFGNIPDKIFELIKNKHYNDVSVEIFWNLEHPETKQKFPRVLSSVALLGEDHPAVWTMPHLDQFLPEKMLAASSQHEIKIYNLNTKGEIMSHENEEKLKVELEQLKKENELLKQERETHEYALRTSEVEKELAVLVNQALINPKQATMLKEFLVDAKKKKKAYKFDDGSLDESQLILKVLSMNTPQLPLGEQSIKGETKEKSPDVLLYEKAMKYSKDHNTSYEKALKAVARGLN